VILLPELLKIAKIGNKSFFNKTLKSHKLNITKFAIESETENFLFFMSKGKWAENRFNSVKKELV